MARKVWIITGFAFCLIVLLVVSGLGQKVKREVLEAAVHSEKLGVRDMLLLEYPSLIRAIKRGGAFGGEFSRQVGTHMFSRDPKAIDDALKLTSIEELAPRTWLIHLPIVNAVLFEKSPDPQ